MPPRSILDIPNDRDVVGVLAGCHHDSHRLALGLVAYAGCRPSEVRALQGRDLAPGRNPILTVRGGLTRAGRVPHGKTGHRSVPIRPELSALLPKRVGPRHVLAPSSAGLEWSESGLAKCFDRAAQRAGHVERGWSIYVLRHYAITRWLWEGIPIHVVMKMAGHARMATTERYTHYLDEDLNRVHEGWTRA